MDSGYGKEGESSMSEAVPIVQSTIPEEDYRTTVDEPPHSPVRIQWRNTLDDGPSPRIWIDKYDSPIPFLVICQIFFQFLDAISLAHSLIIEFTL